MSTFPLLPEVPSEAFLEEEKSTKTDNKMVANVEETTKGSATLTEHSEDIEATVSISKVAKKVP